MNSRYLSAVLAIVVCGMGHSAFSQDYPARPLRLLVGYSPGGVPDITARLFTRHLSPLLGQPITVENRTGAAGQVALRELIQATPDGYSIMLSDAAQWAITPALRPGVYDPLRDLTPICVMGTGNTLLAVRQDFPARNFQEFVAMAKAKPRTVRYSSLGIGSFHHLFMETVANAFGMELVHIPYKGGAAQTQAAAVGEVEVATAAIPTSMALVKAGKLRYLVISLAERSRLAPDVPSMKDVGAPQIDFISYLGIIGPAGMPKPVVERLSGACRKVTQIPEYVSGAVDTTGGDMAYRSSAEFPDLIREDIARFGRAVKISGIKAE